MEFEAEIIWSKKTYAINDLILNEDGQTKRSLPVLVKITRGFYGIKEEDTVDIDQMLVFNASGEETCVCARNEDGCCLSIPINHQHRFQRLNSTGAPHANKETQTLQEILERFRMPTKVRFDETMYTSFTVADKLRNTEEFGALTLVSTHTIEYLQASPVYEGKIHYDHIMFIPNYRDVRFVIAEGPQPFLKSFLDFKDKRRQSHSRQTLSIIGYDDIELSDEEYEVVVPWKLTKPKKTKKDGDDFENELPTENYEMITPMLLSKPPNPDKTDGGEGPMGRRYSEKDFELIVHVKATKAQEANKKGGIKGPKVDTPKPQNGASSSKRDSAIQQRFSRDYEGFKPYKQRDTDEDLQDEERDVFGNVSTNLSKGRHPILRHNSSVAEQARLLEKSLQVLAGGRAGGGKHSRSTSAIPQTAPKPKGGPPKRSSSLGNSPPTHWREPLPLPNFSALPPRSVPQFSKPAPGGSSNRCSTSSNSSSGSNAGFGGSPRGGSPCLNPIGITGATVSPRSESPSLSHSVGVPVGGSPRGESPCLSPLSSSGLRESYGEESPYLSPISLRKGSMSLTTPEDVPLDLSGLSVGDVCDCLQLLNMNTYIARFQEDQIDGALLAECSTDDLKEMGLSTLHAKKLTMFTKGWRPKV